MCIRPTWVKFCSLVSQFVKVSLIILSCAELTSAPEPHLPAQALVSPNRQIIPATPPSSPFFGFPLLIPDKEHFPMFP